MNLDLDLTNFNRGDDIPMECNNMRSMPEKRSKTYEDPSRMVSSLSVSNKFHRGVLIHARLLVSSSREEGEV